MIINFLLKTQMICKMFIKILKIIIYAKKNKKILIVFDDMFVDVFNNKKLNPVVTELSIRGRKLNISIVFIKQLYFNKLDSILHIILL